MRGDGNVRDQWAYPVQSCCHIQPGIISGGRFKALRTRQHIGTIFSELLYYYTPIVYYIFSFIVFEIFLMGIISTF